MIKETKPNNQPNVLCLAALDPSGGAGLQADIESIASFGSHACPVATALTVQNTHNVSHCVPVEEDFILKQATTVLEDMPIAAIKIGLITSSGTVMTIASLLHNYPHIPVVLDPVMRAGGGRELNHHQTRQMIIERLLPHCSLITPNMHEAQQLGNNADNAKLCASRILDYGVAHVLITDTSTESDNIINILYQQQETAIHYTWPRLEHQYHGSGCTLAAAISALMAQGHPIQQAVMLGQQYTWHTLAAGYQASNGQWLPRRLFWGNYAHT